jgi:serine/threonine-protein kinase RsbW
MVSVVRTFVQAVCQARQVDGSIVQTVVLATSEAVSNIVRHAHRDRPERSFQVQCRVGHDAVEVTLLDQGPPFDLLQVPELEPGELRIGGRGVYLMRTLMDEVTCETLGEVGNRLRLVKHLATANQERNCG